MTWEEIDTALKEIWQTFWDNPFIVLRDSVIVYLLLPTIRWLLLALRYFIFQTPELADQFARGTFKGALPWILSFIIDPLNIIVDFILVMLLVTTFYALKSK